AVVPRINTMVTAYRTRKVAAQPHGVDDSQASPRPKENGRQRNPSGEKNLASPRWCAPGRDQGDTTVPYNRKHTISWTPVKIVVEMDPKVSFGVGTITGPQRPPGLCAPKEVFPQGVEEKVQAVRCQSRIGSPWVAGDGRGLPLVGWR